MTSLDIEGQPCVRCQCRARLCKTSTADRFRILAREVAILPDTPSGKMEDSTWAYDPRTALATAQLGAQAEFGGMQGATPHTTKTQVEDRRQGHRMRQLAEEFKAAGGKPTEGETSTRQGKRKRKGMRGRKRRETRNKKRAASAGSSDDASNDKGLESGSEATTMTE
jgi:hypothetical protein